MIKIKKNVLLAPYTNYRIGGPAKYFCETNNSEDIIEALDFADKKNIPIFVLGGGTNMLVSDRGFEGLVIKFHVSCIKLQENNIIVGAGNLLSDVVSFAIKNDLQGLEWAAGIPGTVGGAVRGNAGAFGGEMKDIVKTVKCLDIEGKELVDFNKKELGFEYRSSSIKTKKSFIILSVELELIKMINNEDSKRAKKNLVEYIKYRKEHHPLEYPSCGSIFKNVEAKKINKNKELLENIEENIIPAALLIAKAGLVGKKIGNAQISEKHANFIVNLGNAKAKDVLELINLCQKEVFNKFGAKIESEVQLIGFET